MMYAREEDDPRSDCYVDPNDSSDDDVLFTRALGFWWTREKGKKDELNEEWLVNERDDR